MWRTIGEGPLIMTSLGSRGRSCLEPRMKMKESEVPKGLAVHLKEKKRKEGRIKKGAVVVSHC